MMLRWMVPALVVPALAVMLTASAAVAADLPATPKRRAVVTQQEPPKVYVETDPDALISPAYGIGSYISNLPGTPLLPGSHTLPGYYGRPWDYDYQGSYYGGKQVDYFWRLPYSCGIYGYC